MPSRFCGGGRGGGGQTEEGVDQSGDYRRQSATPRSTELPEQWTLRCTYLDNHHLNGDVVRQSDRRSEVLGQRHQQVQDGDDALRVDGWRAEGKTDGAGEKKEIVKRQNNRSHCRLEGSYFCDVNFNGNRNE